VLRKLLYGVAAERLQASLADDLEWQHGSSMRELVARAGALTLGSPEFQRY
jgi:hypothetical protein